MHVNSVSYYIKRWSVLLDCLDGLSLSHCAPQGEKVILKVSKPLNHKLAKLKKLYLKLQILLMMQEYPGMLDC